MHVTMYGNRCTGRFRRIVVKRDKVGACESNNVCHKPFLSYESRILHCVTFYLLIHFLDNNVSEDIKTNF